MISDLETALGIGGTAIKDCQFTASTGTPSDARLNSADGWLTPPRGPPFYQNEYIQVDLGTLVKFTGISIQPHKLYKERRILNFKLHYSVAGIKWYPLRDGASAEKVRDVITLC